MLGMERSAPAPREMVELETSLKTIEENLREVNTNFKALRKNHLELSELKNMLTKTDGFLAENQFNQFQENGGGRAGASDETTGLLDGKFVPRPPSLSSSDPAPSAYVKDGTDQGASSSLKFNITAGVLDRSRMLAFETMLWRVSKGNVFIKFMDIEEKMVDPNTGDPLYKCVFLIFYQGEELRVRVKKICEGFHAAVFACPESRVERRDMLCGVGTRIEDLHTVLSQTMEHRHRLLIAAATNIRSHYVMVRKMKAIYHILNQFNQRDGGRVLIGECWMPTADIPNIQSALTAGAHQAGSTLPPTIEKVHTNEMHPTYNRTNKYTSGFQSLVDAYGVNSYREVNPSVYTIATFPFLFAVMFGDAGHGVIMLTAALWMILAEKSLEPKRNVSEIFNIFSIYTGLIYNDIFSKSVNIFGSHWSAKNLTFTASDTSPIHLEASMMLDPKDPSQYSNTSYPFGVDPVWQSASNKIGFLNTYKMKISLIFGVLHMTFGVMMSLWNKLSKKQYASIILEFFPQIIFLLGIFGYLILMIFIKWILYGANLPDPYSEHCAPNLLITFINMMLNKKAEVDMKMDGCHSNDKYLEIYMYPGQAGLQSFLVMFGVLMIPIMLFGKPAFIMYKRRQRRAAYGTLRDELLESDHGGQQAEEEGFGEIMINQGIHTIEYVLGSVSHTASYLRLWALSLAHAQLSEVLWSMVMRIAFSFNGYAGAVAIYVIFASQIVGAQPCPRSAVRGAVVDGDENRLLLQWLRRRSRYLRYLRISDCGRSALPTLSCQRCCGRW